MLIIKNSFEISRDVEGKYLESKWMKKLKEYKTNIGKSEYHLLSVLPTHEINRIGK